MIGIGCTGDAFAEFGGLPQEQTPATQAVRDQVNLGRKLFFDKRFSADGTISCASCHIPERAFSDGRRLAVGLKKQIGTRNTPSLLNVRFNSSFFWDGRRDTLENQALDPLINAKEHGLKDISSILKLISKDPDYNTQIASAEQLANAIAAYERTLVAFDSPFDRFYSRGDQSALSASAKRGMQLFQESARCISCHQFDGQHALFTDNKFHQLGVGNSKIANELPSLTQRIVKLHDQNLSLDSSILNDARLAELGRFTVTMKPIDIGRFRTPSLRNVALTAPYMHDGSVPTLLEAVELELYYRSTEIGYPLILTPAEKNDLVEFLKALTSPAALSPPAEWRAPHKEK